MQIGKTGDRHAFSQRQRKKTRQAPALPVAFDVHHFQKNGETLTWQQGPDISQLTYRKAQSMSQTMHAQGAAFPRKWGYAGDGRSVWIDENQATEMEPGCDDGEVVTRLAGVSSRVIFNALQFVESSIENDEISQGKQALKTWGVSRTQAGNELHRRGVLK
ncbi:hypothetical protein HFO56_34010 [Rhizobium laguerreae]|uniref:hypothetical protein n=1 Tax=Rhizobium laguerreae TaxID=1076926 RepID=UPI001C904381|nr:hypothetical protein [Rhizobium laguerreae]MBY3157342.1 hypothetical protein [Rhizobium laguerreae]